MKADKDLGKFVEMLQSNTIDSLGKHSSFLTAWRHNVKDNLSFIIHNDVTFSYINFLFAHSHMLQVVFTLIH